MNSLCCRSALLISYSGLPLSLPTLQLTAFPIPGIDLENIVYYKDDTHYFVMTAKKKSLLKKGVIKQVGTTRLKMCVSHWHQLVFPVERKKTKKETNHKEHTVMQVLLQR